MISVWAKFYPTTQNYKALDALGGIHRRQVEPRPEEPTDAAYLKANWRDWVGPGYSNAFYDPYNPQAKALYSKQIIDNLRRRHRLKKPQPSRGSPSINGPEPLIAKSRSRKSSNHRFTKNCVTNV